MSGVLDVGSYRCQELSMSGVIDVRSNRCKEL